MESECAFGKLAALWIMFLHVAGLRWAESEILDSIIPTVSIFMMNNLMRFEKPSEMAFHDKPMFENVSIWRCPMPVNPLDAVALAIFAFESGHLGNPRVPAIQNNNAGNLEGGIKVDARNYDVFPDFVSGYSALLRELRDKFTGNNKHGIGPDSTLLDLFNVYAPPSDNNPTNSYCEFVASWVTQALGRQVTPDTKLRDIWFAPVTDPDLGMD